MLRNEFWALLGLVRADIELIEEIDILWTGQPIPVECRFAMASWILACPSYLDVTLALGVGRSTFCSTFREVRTSSRVPLFFFLRVPWAGCRKWWCATF